jgi:hypothetical protein
VRNESITEAEVHATASKDMEILGFYPGLHLMQERLEKAEATIASEK